VTVADAPFDLSEAKLASPSTRPGTVAKTDVIKDLCASREPLVTVVAPAGYGKTTILARWAEADPRPFAWVALDPRDDDPVVLLRYVAGAMHRLDPLPPEVFEALSGAGVSGWTKRVARLGNALAAREQPFVLALDDLHSVANPSCSDVLAELLRSIPAGSKIALATREEPVLPLGRWRAQGWVREIGPAELRLDGREAEELLRAAGVELGEDEVNELTQRTEGWAAGLYLAALSIQAGSPNPASAEVFSGNDRFVTDYFRVELMSRLPGAEARFLEQTSVLERMCGGLCDSVVESTGSAGVLEQLERTNRFVVPLDRRGEWYRYHHLFAELLRNELARSEPDAAAEISRKAMAWCIANDLPEAALIYGQAAGPPTTTVGWRPWKGG
jgi:LuxR family maltose regulon positive regulatory protein